MQKETMFFLRIHIFKAKNDRHNIQGAILLVGEEKEMLLGRDTGEFEDFGNVPVLKLSNTVHRYLSYYLIKIMLYMLFVCIFTIKNRQY